jgi:DNA-binding CsgD family transcriptional regulator
MSTVRLTESGLDAVRTLLALDPEPTERLPERRTLVALEALWPCELIGLAVTDRAGVVVAHAARPPWTAWHPRHGWRPQVGTGVRRAAADHDNPTGGERPTYSLTLGVDAGSRGAAQLSLHRQRHPFSEPEQALLRTLAPHLEGLLRRWTGPHPAAVLTRQEGRVLRLVATGMSNADVAAQLHLASSTVRKHLEHAFRKLGVTNRLAAVHALESLPPAPVVTHAPAREVRLMANGHPPPGHRH